MASNGSASPAAAGAERRSVVTEYTLAPKSLTILRDGTVSAQTLQGLALVQEPRGAPAVQTVLPLPKERPAALLGSDPSMPGTFAWLTADAGGRVLLRRTTSHSEDLVATVPGAERILVCDHFVIIVDDASRSHFFLVPPALVDAAESADILATFTPLGVVAPPGESADDFIGVALCSGVEEGRCAAALFSQRGAALSVSVVVLSGNSPATATWTAAVEMPTEELPLTWAVSSSGAVVAVVPRAASHAPFLLLPGKPTPKLLSRQLGGNTSVCVGVASCGVQGMLFATRAAAAQASTVELRFLPSPQSATAASIVTLSGLTLRRSTAIVLAVHRLSRGAYKARILVGRTLHKVHLAALSSAESTPGQTEGLVEPSGADAGADVAPKPAGSLALLTQLAAANGQGNARPATVVVSFAGTGALSPSELVGLLKAGKPLPKGHVLRDPGVSAEGGHTIVDEILHKTDAHSQVKVLSRYLETVRDVDASTLLHALAVVCVASSAPSPRGSPKGGNASSSEHARDPAAAAIAAGHLLEACGDRMRGSLHGAWRQLRAASAHASSAALPSAVFTATFAVLLHALSTGRLGVVQLATSVMDAVVVSDVDALLEQCADTLGNAQAMLASVGRWASAEPGQRLGQLTAHSGPECTMVKEAQVMPLQGHKIRTAATIRIDRERQLL
jgi:hypothetical protein